MGDEKQENLEDQNQQEAVQTETAVEATAKAADNPATQAVSKPADEKKNSKGFLISILVLVIILLALVGYFAWSNIQDEDDNDNSPIVQDTPIVTKEVMETEVPTPTVTIEVTPTEVVVIPTPTYVISGESDAQPLDNYLYYGEYRGATAIYLNGTIQWFVDEGVGNTTEAYSALIKPIRLLKIPEQGPDTSLSSFYISENNEEMLLSFYSTKDSQVYLANLKTKEIKKIWDKSIPITEDNYDGFRGAGVGVKLIDSYAVIEVAPCHQCDEVSEYAYVVLDTDTNRERYVGKVGNIEIDLNNNKIMAKRMEKVEESCEYDPNAGMQRCSVKGTMSVYRPVGENVEFDLP